MNHSYNSNRKKSSFNVYYKTILTVVLLTVLPVLIVSILSYNTIRRQNYDILENSIQAESMKRLAEFNTKLSDMPKAISTFKKNKAFISGYQREIPFKYIDIMNELKNATLWTSFYKDIYFYDTKDELFVSARGTEHSQRFFDANMKTFVPVDFRDYENEERSFIYSFNEGINKGSVVVITPFERGNKTDQIESYFLFFIQNSTLQDYTSTSFAGEGCVAMLLYHDSPFFTSNDECNQLLYKDSPLPSDLYGDQYVNYTYTNGAYSLNWSVPQTIYNQNLLSIVLVQAVITVILISLTVLFLFLFISKEYQPLSEILVNLPQPKKSGRLHHEFSQISFIVKDMLFIQKTLKETNLELQREKHLYIILGNNIKRYSQLYHSMLDSGIRIDRQRFLCVLLEDKPENIDGFVFLKEKLPAIHDHTDVYELFVVEHRYAFLICTDIPTEELNQLLRQNKIDHSRPCIGIGKIVEEPDKIPKSYRVAVNGLIEDSDIKDNTGDSLFPDIEIEALAEGVSLDNHEKVKASLKMIKENLTHYSDFAKMYLLVRTVCIFNEKDEIKAMKSLNQDISLSEGCLRTYLSQLYNTYTDTQNKNVTSITLVSGKSNNIKRICQYIEANYQSYDFSVNSMAAQFQMSPSNISHYFKKMTGQTITRYIESIRMKEGARLLQENRLLVFDIASQLGYSSTSSFIQAFKRYYDITPKAYQKQQHTEK